MALTIALVGNPNCGKSTLFNALTKGKEKVGNWPGVTVECKTGYFDSEAHHVQVVDLPGVYQLSQGEERQALDERVACNYILSNRVDFIVNVVDATSLERHLYLTLQLRQMHIPMIVAVNMLDVTNRRNIEFDLKKLSQELKCPVVGLVANKGIGVDELTQLITNGHKSHHHKPLEINYPKRIALSIKKLKAENIGNDWFAQQLLEGNLCAHQKVSSSCHLLALQLKEEIEQELQEEVDVLFAATLYETAHLVYQTIVKEGVTKKTFTDHIDKIVLHRYLGIPIFLAVMYCMFLFAINFGGAFQDFFDISSNAIFVQGTTFLLEKVQAPAWLVALLAAGFGRGINTTVSFIPVIGAMFFFLSFLESSGYMARATLVVDRLMRLLGLPGKSFVPMIVGFGCNVPAILAARTLETPRGRTLTIIMSPFMSCGARLAIFAVFTAAFFPYGGQNIVFALYFIGISAAILTGFILRKTLLQGQLTPLVLELSPYHLPSVTILLKQTWHRLQSFIFRAGKLIIPICMLIGLLNAFQVDGTVNKSLSNKASLLATAGKFVTPVFSPMGITDNNWPATVGLVTGVLAKEVVIATLNTLYTQEANCMLSQKPPKILKNLKEAVLSIPANLSQLKHSIVNPIIAAAPEQTVDRDVYGIMYERFASQEAAFAYLLFVLLYFPCVSAVAVMAKELNKNWAFFSIAWSTGMAYTVATCFYQLATITVHPRQSLIWLILNFITFSAVLSLMKAYSSHAKNINNQLGQLT